VTVDAGGALDQELTQDTELHCMGGFVLAEHYGLVRATGDVDVLQSAGTDKATIARLAGRGSPLHKRHRVYIDIVTVADVPDDYDTRLVAMDVEGLARLRLKVFERHDLVLAKLCRNIDRDREDVWRLSVALVSTSTSCGSGTKEELRPKLGRPEREDLTLRLWIETIEELRGGA
jgi:hypothetical protein